MATMIVGAGLVGHRLLAFCWKPGERPVLMDRAHQSAALGEIVDLDRVILTNGNVLQPLELMRLLREHSIDAIVQPPPT